MQEMEPMLRSSSTVRRDGIRVYKILTGTLFLTKVGRVLWSMFDISAS